jgi:succinylglutamate desuccinylase
MQWVKIFNFSDSWPTTLIVWLVHWNEIVGKKSIEYLHKKIKNKNLTWKIITLYANLKWHKFDKRFIDSDLNRCFDQDNTKWNYEIKRANQIKKFFEDIPIDYMFDLHSTSSKSDPMILCNSQKSSLTLSSNMPIKHVIQWLIDIVEWTSMLKHFQTKLKLGMAFECGCHKDGDTITKWKEIIDIILDFHQGKKLQNQKDQIKIKITDIVYTSDPKFMFSKTYKWFEKLNPWEVRAVDNNWKHSFKKSKILVMPNMIIAQELEKKSSVWVAFFWDIIEKN